MKTEQKLSDLPQQIQGKLRETAVSLCRQLYLSAYGKQCESVCGVDLFPDGTYEIWSLWTGENRNSGSIDPNFHFDSSDNWLISLCAWDRHDLFYWDEVNWSYDHRLDEWIWCGEGEALTEEELIESYIDDQVDFNFPFLDQIMLTIWEYCGVATLTERTEE